MSVSQPPGFIVPAREAVAVRAAAVKNMDIRWRRRRQSNNIAGVVIRHNNNAPASVHRRSARLSTSTWQHLIVRPLPLLCFGSAPNSFSLSRKLPRKQFSSSSSGKIIRFFRRCLVACWRRNANWPASKLGKQSSQRACIDSKPRRNPILSGRLLAIAIAGAGGKNFPLLLEIITLFPLACPPLHPVVCLFEPSSSSSKLNICS